MSRDHLQQSLEQHVGVSHTSLTGLNKCLSEIDLEARDEREKHDADNSHIDEIRSHGLYPRLGLMRPLH